MKKSCPELECRKFMVRSTGISDSMFASRTLVVEEESRIQDDLRILLCNSCVTYRYPSPVSFY